MGTIPREVSDGQASTVHRRVQARSGQAADAGERPASEVAMRMAITHCKPAAGLIHHTDRGALYSSANYRRLMAADGLLPSMSRHGDCYDNACAESFFSSLKNELVHGEVFAIRDAARVAIVSYIEGFYNRKRLHQHSAI